MELYRVLLVDDEENIREGISRKMDRRSSCNPANSRSDFPLNSKNMDIPFRFASLRGIIAAKEAAIGSLLFHPAKPEDRAAEVP